MEAATALSTNPVAAHAIGEVLADLLERIGPAPAAAVIVVTPSFGGTLDDIRNTVAEALGPRLLVCAISAGVFADGVEIVASPAIAAWATNADVGALWTGGDASIATAGSIDGRNGAAFVLLDSELIDPDGTLQWFESRLPRHELVGGILSGSSGPTRLIAPDGNDASAVVIVVDDAESATVWGAAPIDEVRFAEISDGSMVTRLDGELALDVVIECLGTIPDDERSGVARSLRFALLGPDEFGLVPVLGTDRLRGAIAIGGSASDGTLVQLLRGDDPGLRDSIIRTLLPSPGVRLVATTGLEDRSDDEPTPGSLVAELSGGSAIGPIVAAIVSTVRSGPSLVDAPLVVVTCDRSRD